MAYRSSLTNCIAMMHHQFKLGNYAVLSIIHNERGKYYTLMTDDELADKQPDASPDGDRLLLRATKKELHTICRSPNLDMFPEDPHAAN